MKFIKDFKDGDIIKDIYLCKTKSIAKAKTGKDYFNVMIQDKTGTADLKVWDVNSAGIEEFVEGDYINLEADVVTYNGAIQLKARRIIKAKEGEYDPINYSVASKRNTQEMENELDEMINSINTPYLKTLLNKVFVEDKEFRKKFTYNTAAKSVHHGFIHGLLEHTLSVAKTTEAICKVHTDLNKDLSVSAALCHDIGKVYEYTDFPSPDYTDEGQLIGHIVIGYEILSRKIEEIKDFPESVRNEFLHIILSHHGKMEFGSPKLPALMEAIAVSFADDLDAKLETMREVLDQAEQQNKKDQFGFIGFNKFINSNLRKTTK